MSAELPAGRGQGRTKGRPWLPLRFGSPGPGLFVSLLGLLLGCESTEGPKACTLIGCLEQVSIVVRASDGLTPTFAVNLDIDGGPAKCLAPERGGPGMCNGPNVELFHRELQDCVETRREGTLSVSCRGNGRFEEVITIRGTPARVAVTLLNVADIAAERVFDLAYTENNPNGPGCGPGCRQSKAEWVLP